MLEDLKKRKGSFVRGVPERALQLHNQLQGLRRIRLCTSLFLARAEHLLSRDSLDSGQRLFTDAGRRPQEKASGRCHSLSNKAYRA